MGFNHGFPLKLVVDRKVVGLPFEATVVLLSCLTRFSASLALPFLPYGGVVSERGTARSDTIHSLVVWWGVVNGV